MRRGSASDVGTGRSGLRRLWCWLWSPRVPDPWPAGAWHCPSCGRRLVGEGPPGRGTPLRWERMTPAQRVRECLVDGSPLRGEQRSALTEDEIVAGVLDLAAELRDGGERRWAHRLEAAVRRADDRLYHVAHQLYWLRRDRCRRALDVSTVDRLLVAIGLRWPATGPRPAGPPRLYGPPPP